MHTLKKEAPKLTQEVSTPCPSRASRPPHRARSQDVQSWALAGHNQLCPPLHSERKRRFHGLSHAHMCRASQRPRPAGWILESGPPRCGRHAPHTQPLGLRCHPCREASPNASPHQQPGAQAGRRQ